MTRNTRVSLAERAAALWHRAVLGARGARQGLLAYGARAVLRRVFGRAPAAEVDRRPRPLVSLLLAVRGDAGALEETARSALENTHDAVELLLVQAAAGPELEAAVARLRANPRVRMVPGGPAAAVARAGGALVAWLSSDYLLFPGTLTAMVDALLLAPEALLAWTEVAHGAARVAGGQPLAWPLHRRTSPLLFDPSLADEPAVPVALLSRLAAAATRVEPRDRLPYCLRRAAWTERAPQRTAERGAATDPPWTLTVDPALEWNTLAGEVALGRGLCLRTLPEHWELAGRDASGEEWSFRFWRGWTALAAGQAARERGGAAALPAARNRPVIGCHLAAGPGADVEGARRLVERSRAAFFAFLDVPGSDLGQEIARGLENAAALGQRPFGEAHDAYVRFDLIWAPPAAATPAAEAGYRKSLALAYAIGRPLLAAQGCSFTAAPYQHAYLPEESLDFAVPLAKAAIDPGLAGRYLARWTPEARLREVLGAANALAAGQAVVTAHTEPPPPRVEVDGRMRLLLAADTLHTGGLEATVAQIATHLPRRGVEVAVLCVHAGGATADRLAAQGVPVYLAHAHPRAMRDALRQFRPQVLNSHLASLELLKAASSAGVAVVETIQNTYVWFDRAQWDFEVERSRYFTRAAPVSSLVRTYYAKWNPAFRPQWMTVVPNLVDVRRVPLIERADARRELGLAEGDVVFLNLASYQAQKNQVGLLAAFDAAARRDPRLRLVCAGRAGEPPYHEYLLRQHGRLRARDRVDLHPFRDDTPLLLAACDVFVLDSFFEGWSVAATEALVAGRPLLLAECGSARDLLGADGGRGLLVPNPAGDALALDLDALFATAFRERQRNTAALVQALGSMADAHAEWRRRGPGIAALARAELDFESSAGRYHALFEEALAAGRPLSG